MWTLGVVGFLVASAYSVGGPDVFRQLVRRSRDIQSQAAAALQPPTQAQVQAATVDTNTMAARIDQAEPVSMTFVVLSIGGVLGLAVALFYITGRQRNSRRA